MEKLMKNKKLIIMMQFLPLLLFIGSFVFYGTSGKEFAVKAILSYTPHNYLLAILFILFLYAAKSLSFLLPIIILYITGGILFPAPAAILINIAGTAICLTISFEIGYYSGADFTKKLHLKYSKIHNLTDKMYANDWFISYFLRIVNYLPGDIVSIYLGTRKIPYYKYMAGSLLGLFPSIVFSTLIGVSITDPASPVFILSVAFKVVLSILSVLLYRIVRKRKSQNNRTINGNNTHETV